MNNPTIGLLENAANATFWSPSLATAFGLSQMRNAAGSPLEVETANGCTAAAFSAGPATSSSPFRARRRRSSRSPTRN